MILLNFHMVLLQCKQIIKEAHTCAEELWWPTMGLSGCSIQSLHERVYSVYGACAGSMAGGRDIIQHQAHSICSLNTHLYD